MPNPLQLKSILPWLVVATILMLAALACGTAAASEPRTIEKEVIVEKEVIKEVIKEVPIEVVVEKEVVKEVEKLVLVTPIPRPKKTIVFSDLSWESAQLQNRIAMYVVEKGYGYPVDTIFGDTISLFDGLIKGDTHVTMEIWLPNQQEAWDKAVAEGSVISVGRSLDDNWQSAFVIPTYVAEQNPGLESVQDLIKFKDLFKTADSGGKARLVTCIPGWECEKVNEAKLKAYGLEDTVELVNPGSSASLFASLQGAYDKGEPWLGYMWGPTTIAVELDLTILEEPPYNENCWSTDKGCSYPTSQIMIVVNPELLTRAPEVVEFLRRWDFTASSQVAAEGWMSDNEATTEEAAVWFLQNQDVWVAWVTEDAAGNVRKALAAEG